MKNLLHRSDYENIVERLNALTPETKAKWGKMNVTQMMAHCAIGFDTAHGKLVLKRGLIGFLFGKIAKKQFTQSNKPFKQNLPTSPQFITTGLNADFQETKLALLDKVNDFYHKGETAITQADHPFFGKMTTDEWGILMYKHIDHHLTQFGA